MSTGFSACNTLRVVYLNKFLMEQMYTRDASKGWRQSAPDASSQLALKEPSANVVLLDYVSTEKWKQIVDFDDHLDDISK